MTILIITDLQVDIDSHGEQIEVIRSLSLSVSEGETLGIVGESGCGKTLLMKAIVGLLPNTAKIRKGSILFKGTNLLEKTKEQIQQVRGKEIGIIFQDPMSFLNPTMKIGTQIAESFLRHHPKATKKEGKEMALQLLKQVHVSEPSLRIEQYPHLLSGGIRQRVLTAIALAAGPHLLIADEPTTSLDVTLQAQILDLLWELQRDKTTVLITHDLSLVANFCDRVAVMYAGEIVEESDVETLFSHPRHPYTRRLIDSIPRLDQNVERLRSIPGTPPHLGCLGKGCAFAPRCPNVMPICHVKPPPLCHNTRCWLYDDRR